MSRKEILSSAAAIVVAAAVLLVARLALGGVIQSRSAAEAQAMMETILPGSTTFQSEAYSGEDENITAVWAGETGYVVETVVDGYAGEIRVWTGVDTSGRVTGLVVRDMSETWGLGREALTDTRWLGQFVQTNGNAEVGANVDAITGATVTSKAVAKAVNSAAAFVTGADVSTGATEWGG